VRGIFLQPNESLATARERHLGAVLARQSLANVSRSSGEAV